MRIVLKAKDIIKTYKVNTGKIQEKFSQDLTIKEYYDKKPTLDYDETEEWKVDILSYEGELAYNYYGGGGIFRTGLNKSEEMNISETETVSVIKVIFRADLNEYHVYTNKINSRIELNKEEAKNELKKEIALYNRAMIESNDKMKRYCLDNALIPEEHNPKEIFKFVYPNKGMKIVDGEIIAVSHLSESTIEECGTLNSRYTIDSLLRNPTSSTIENLYI